MTEELGEQASPVRNVAASLLDRRWPMFFMELVLIVVGILIALTIDGLAQDREDRQIEATYLELLRDDLEQIEAEVAEFIKFQDSVLTTGKVFMDAISAEGPSSNARTLQGMLGEISVRRTLWVDSAAYTDLTSTGNLRLIGNQELRRQLVQFFADTERSELIAEKNSKEYVDDIFVPFLLDSGVVVIADQSALTAITNTGAVLRNTLGPEFSWPPNNVLQQPPDAPSWDDFRRQVLFRMFIAAGGKGIGEVIIESSRQMRFQIEEELNRRDTG